MAQMLKKSGVFWRFFVTNWRSNRLLWVAHASAIRSWGSGLKSLKWITPVPGSLALSLWSREKSTPSEEEKRKNLLVEADGLYNHQMFDLLYDLLMMHKDSDDCEILWRLARATFERSKSIKEEKLRKQLVYEAFDHIQRAIDSGDQSNDVHRWKGILLSEVSQFEGYKAQIRRSFEIRDEFKRAVELDPLDATAWHLLGCWCGRVTSVPWYQRQFASVIFATPPTSSYEEALENFLKAEAISPNFYSQNLLMIGKTYAALSKKELAREYLKKTIDYVVVTTDDIDAHAEADKLLKTI